VRGADDLFTLHDFTGAARFPLLSIGCELATDEVFDAL
jgi:hypothetical protein